MYEHGLWGLSGLSMTLSMVLFWSIIVVLAVGVLRALFGNPQPQSPGKAKRSPVALARERYARGEITQDEYSAILGDLEETQ